MYLYFLLIFLFVSLIGACACHNLLFHRNLAFAWLSWHHCQAANVCFRLTLASDMRSFSALEHRFLQDMHLYRAAVFHKKIATQRKVVWRKDVYNRKNPQQFSTTYITQIATLCQTKKMGHFYLGFKRSDPFFANKTSKRWFKSTKRVTKKHSMSVCLKIELDSSISERASELAKSEACRPKGGSHGKAVIVLRQRRTQSSPQKE